MQVYAPRSFATYYEEFQSLMEWGDEACEKLLASKHIDALLDLSRVQKFDVLITEFFNTDCALGLAYKLNITNYIGMVRMALVKLPHSPFFSAFAFQFSNSHISSLSRLRFSLSGLS